MGTLGAILVNHRVASGVNPRDIFPPLKGLILSLNLVPKAELAQIFKHDITALDVSVGRLDGAVLSTSEAVIIEVSLIAVSALPEDVTRSELKKGSEVLLNLGKVFEEVDGPIR